VRHPALLPDRPTPLRVLGAVSVLVGVLLLLGVSLLTSLGVLALVARWAL
jgi:hypothetical protein